MPHAVFRRTDVVISPTTCDNSCEPDAFCKKSTGSKRFSDIPWPPSNPDKIIKMRKTCLPVSGFEYGHFRLPPHPHFNASCAQYFSEFFVMGVGKLQNVHIQNPRPVPFCTILREFPLVFNNQNMLSYFVEIKELFRSLSYHFKHFSHYFQVLDVDSGGR